MRRDIPRIAEEIRRYCATHPHACDTLEGITWWVQMQIQSDIRDSVTDAVHVLVEEGKLVRHVLQDGSEVFGCRIGAADRPPCE